MDPPLYQQFFEEVKTKGFLFKVFINFAFLTVARRYRPFSLRFYIALLTWLPGVYILGLTMWELAEGDMSLGQWALRVCVAMMMTSLALRVLLLLEEEPNEDDNGVGEMI